VSASEVSLQKPMRRNLKFICQQFICSPLTTLSFGVLVESSVLGTLFQHSLQASATTLHSGLLHLGDPVVPFRMGFCHDTSFRDPVSHFQWKLNFICQQFTCASLTTLPVSCRKHCIGNPVSALLGLLTRHFTRGSCIWRPCCSTSHGFLSQHFAWVSVTILRLGLP
jgi:hypothetical protein